MSGLVERAANIFDPLHEFWEHPRTQRHVSNGLIAAFLGGLIGIELNRRGLLPAPLSSITPTSHYYAISLAFTLVLIMEVAGLVFALPCSVSKAVGKQFEILALILLRNSFKELVYFPEPIDLTTGMDEVWRILSDGAGALVIFAIMGVYYRMHRSRNEVIHGVDRYEFVNVKKAIALFLLAVFVGIAIHDSWLALTGRPTYGFFGTFYTVLIFSDILIVLISQRYLPVFHAIFRNSGYALSTLLIRLALTAPQYYDAALGVAAAFFTVALAWLYSIFAPAFEHAAKYELAPPPPPAAEPEIDAPRDSAPKDNKPD